MENPELFKETLLSSCIFTNNNDNDNNNNSLFKTIPTTEINNIIEKNKQFDEIEEIFHKYNNLKNKIQLFVDKIR